MILSQNSGYPEQLISLPNPNLSEPRVTMETKKLIFKPEADVNTRIRDEKHTLEKPNIGGKVMVPLSLMGRDEADIKNMLWLTGTSKVILWSHKTMPCSCSCQEGLVPQETSHKFCLISVICMCICICTALRLQLCLPRISVCLASLSHLCPLQQPLEFCS